MHIIDIIGATADGREYIVFITDLDENFNLASLHITNMIIQDKALGKKSARPVPSSPLSAPLPVSQPIPGAASGRMNSMNIRTKPLIMSRTGSITNFPKSRYRDQRAPTYRGLTSPTSA